MTTTALARVSKLDRYMAEISRFPILSQDEETRLAKRWRDFGDVDAAHRLVTANLRFVVKIAHEYRGYGARILDLIQEGSVGLMQAVKRFDPDKGYRLLTYAVYWIRSYIHSFLMRTTRMMRIGTSRAHRKLFFKLRSLKAKLGANGVGGQDDIIDAVAENMGVDRSDVVEMDQYLSSKDASLDAPVAATGTALAELLPSGMATQEEALAAIEIAADRSARLESAISSLDERERRIIEQRHLTDEPVELQDIGREMGVSKQRVYQLERRALGTLKNLLTGLEAG
jgi:RNA polymerase sigma-32 factor